MSCSGRAGVRRAAAASTSARPLSSGCSATDAAVRVDTTGRTIEDALDEVVDALEESGHLDLRAADPTESRARMIAT